jgi:hypothetical protein
MTPDTDSYSNPDMVSVSLLNDGETLIQTDEFEALTRPLIKYLCDNYTPYYGIRITQSSAELQQILTSYFTTEYCEGNNGKD